MFLFCMCLSGSFVCELLTFVWSSCCCFFDPAEKWLFSGMQCSHPCCQAFCSFLLGDSQ